MTFDRRQIQVDDQTMGGMLRWQAVNRPDTTAVVCGPRRLSWAQLNKRTNQLANGLLGLGLRPGDRVAVLLGNCAEYIEIYQAMAKSRLTAVPVNTALTASEVSFQLTDSGACALIYDPARASVVEQLDRAGQLTIERTRRIQLAGTGPGSYEALLADAGDADPALVADRADYFYQGYTSGTTGQPKGCLQRHGAFVEHYKRSLTVYGHNCDDVMLIPGPLFHEAPILFSLAQLFFGGRVVILPAFSAEAALEAIATERCTVVGFAVPTMLDRITTCTGAYDVCSVRSIITAGAPLPEGTRQATLDRFPDTELHEFYGATELGLITDVEHRAHQGKGATTGRVFPGVNVVVLDDQDEPLAPGEIGQVFITPVMMDGYHNRPDATAADTREFGGVRWFTLGDLGRVDDEGFLYLIDRKSSMIITGGENVYPAEVEAVLQEHPAIDEIAVIGRPDERWGEAVTAVIVSNATAPTPEEIRAFCADRLAGYKIPKNVLTVTAIPHTSSGKIQRHALRKQLDRQT